MFFGVFFFFYVLITLSGFVATQVCQLLSGSVPLGLRPFSGLSVYLIALQISNSSHHFCQNYKSSFILDVSVSFTRN